MSQKFNKEQEKIVLEFFEKQGVAWGKATVNGQGKPTDNGFIGYINSKGQYKGDDLFNAFDAIRQDFSDDFDEDNATADEIAYIDMLFDLTQIS